MAEHPAKGCTPAQVRAFEAILIGQDSGINPRTINALLDKGLIDMDPIEELWGGPIGTPLYTVSITRYFVPIHLQIQWCRWCSELPDLMEADV